MNDLEQNPLVSGNFYEGDLLKNVHRVPAEFWKQHPELNARFQEILLTVSKLPIEVLRESDLDGALLEDLPGRPYQKCARFAVYYPPPENAEREARISAVVTAGEGFLCLRESSVPTRPKAAVCLTYQCATWEQAKSVLQSVRHLGEYVEAPYYTD